LVPPPIECGTIAKSPDIVLSWLPGIIRERHADCQSLIMLVYDIFNLNTRFLLLMRAAMSGIREEFKLFSSD
jgi:hypothetical protein